MKSVLTLLRILLIVIATLVFGTIALICAPFDRRGKIFHALGRMWSRVILWVCGIKITVSGTEHIKQGERYIYVSNHASLFDIPAVMAGIPDQIRIVYKRELEKIPFFGWLLKTSPYVTIDRERSFRAQKSLERAAERIRRGASVLLFAEGTRSRDGFLQPFKRGAFNLATKTGISIIPLTINGSYDRRPRGKFLIKPGVIELIINRPMLTNSGEGKEYELSLMNRVYEIIKMQFKEPTTTVQINGGG